MNLDQGAIFNLNPIFKRTYYVLRPFIPLRVRWPLQKRVAGSIDGFRVKPMWPLPEPIYENELLFSDEMGGVPFVITHDVDTRFGFQHIKYVVELERRVGLRGSWNIVPHLYEINEAVFEYLRASGIEIGVHDWNHDGRLFSDKAIFDDRITRINGVISDWGVEGFRAGMAFHNDEWMQALKCEYDSSYYDTDPYQPMGGGCCRISPFMLGHLVELPYTMPQDHVLFVAGAGLKVPREWKRKEERGKRNWEWIRRYIARNPHPGEIGSAFHGAGITPMKREEKGFMGQAQIDADHKGSRKGAKAQRKRHVSHPGTISQSYGAGRGHREFKGADYSIIKGVDIWKMKAEWLMERGGMVLMITHPDYLCHPRLRRRKEERGKRKEVYDGWLGEDDGDIQEVRERGIVEEKWFGSLLEQYAAFLNWFKREFEGRYWHCLPRELAAEFRRVEDQKVRRSEGEKADELLSYSV